MRQYFFGPLAAVLCLLVSMCGGPPKPVGESTPDSAPPSAAVSLPAPSSKATIPTPDAAWVPVSLGAEKGAELRAALGNRKKIAVVVPKAHDARALEERIEKMVKALSPDTAVVASREAVLDRYMEDRTVVLFHDAAPSGSAPSGANAPVYFPKDDALSSEWRSKKGPLKEVDAVLVVRPLKSDDKRAGEMRTLRTGSCKAVEDALEAGLLDSGAYFSAYESRVTSILGNEFSRQIHKAAPFWREELKQAAAIAKTGSTAARCASAYSKFLEKYDPCLAGSCALGPRLFAALGLIGMVDESALIPDTCPSEGMRDFAAEIRELGDRALAETIPSLSDAWIGEMLRVGGLLEMQKGLADLCAPRIRRVDNDGLEEAQKSLGTYLLSLKEGDYSGTWERMRGQERVAGVGPVRVLGRVKARLEDPRVEATAVLREMRKASRCSDGSGRILQVSLVDTKTSEILYLDNFFEETLLCEEMPSK